jgi:hypothetical protein
LAISEKLSTIECSLLKYDAVLTEKKPLQAQYFTSRQTEVEVYTLFLEKVLPPQIHWEASVGKDVHVASAASTAVAEILNGGSEFHCALWALAKLYKAVRMNKSTTSLELPLDAPEAEPEESRRDATAFGRKPTQVRLLEGQEAAMAQMQARLHAQQAQIQAQMQQMQMQMQMPQAQMPQQQMQMQQQMMPPSPQRMPLGQLQQQQVQLPQQQMPPSPNSMPPAPGQLQLQQLQVPQQQMPPSPQQMQMQKLQMPQGQLQQHMQMQHQMPPQMQAAQMQAGFSVLEVPMEISQQQEPPQAASSGIGVFGTLSLHFTPLYLASHHCDHTT